jgi:hypothetical protein
VPRRNESRSLQISGVKSGAIWSESTENRCCHIQGYSKSSYGRTILCLTSQTRRVWWCVCTGKMHFHDSQSATLCQSVRAHQKFHYFIFAVPRTKYAQQQKRHHDRKIYFPPFSSSLVAHVHIANLCIGKFFNLSFFFCLLVNQRLC